MNWARIILAVALIGFGLFILGSGVFHWILLHSAMWTGLSIAGTGFVLSGVFLLDRVLRDTA